MTACRYGSDDAGRVVRVCDPRVNAVMRATCARLRLSGHNAGPAGARALFFGPVDLEVHRVTYDAGGEESTVSVCVCVCVCVCVRARARAARAWLWCALLRATTTRVAQARYYVADVARVLPPMVVPGRPEGACRVRVIPPDPSDAEIADSGVAPAGILAARLGAGPRARLALSGGLLYCAAPLQGGGAAPLNPRASALAAAPIRGVAVLVSNCAPALVNLTRPEVLPSLPAALNADAVIGLGSCARCRRTDWPPCDHNAARDAADIADATRFVVARVDDLAAAINANTVAVADNGHIVRELHARGINLRCARSTAGAGDPPRSCDGM